MAENFSGFHYISNAQLEDTSDLIRVEITPRPIKQIAIFMGCFCLAALVISLAFTDDKGTTFGLGIAGLFYGAMMVVLLWAVSQHGVDSKQAAIDKERQELILPSGTKIEKDEIAYFRQFETVAANFRLVLTTVVSSNQNKQFAVCAEIGRFKTTNIGNQIANHFAAEVVQRKGVVESQDLFA